MYTLVSAAVLAADLVRHPSGGAVVDILDAALRLGPDDLERLGRAYVDDPDRRRSWATVEAAAGLRTSVQAALGDVSAALAPGAPTAALGEAEQGLYRASFGGLGELLTLLQEETLGWTRRRVDDLVVQHEPLGVRAVTDALGAAYVDTAVPGHVPWVLRRPWTAVFGELPVVAPADAFGPRSAAVRRLVDRTATAGPGRLAALTDRHRAAREGADWVATMHTACQAAFVHGRVRQVAAAQLGLARATLIAGLRPEQAAAGAMTALTGAAQAVALADLLDDGAVARLTAGWVAAFGEL